MATVKAYLTAYISDEVEIEVDDPDTVSIEDLARKRFEQIWIPLNQEGGYTHAWGYVEVDECVVEDEN